VYKTSINFYQEIENCHNYLAKIIFKFQSSNHTQGWI